MAVRISNTKHFKKGEKLPNGETAKRGTVWNTRTNRPVTGTVVMGASGASASTKKYKAGRSVSAMKAKAEKARKPSAASSGGSAGGSAGGGGTSAAKKALAKRLEQNKGVKGGTVRAGAAGRGVRKYNAKTGRWDRVVQRGTGTAANQNQTPAGAKSSPRTPMVSGTVSSAMSKKTGSYTPGTGGGKQYDKALLKARTRKYGADTPGNRAFSAIGKALSGVTSTKTDAQVKANNQRVAAERRAREAAATAALKAAREKKNR